MSPRKRPQPAPDEVHAQRLESLLAAVWDAAMEGSMGAVGEARRILAEQAKFYGFGAPDAPAARVKVETADELAAYRARYGGNK